MLVVDIERVAKLLWGRGGLKPVDLAKALFELDRVRKEPLADNSLGEFSVLYSLAFEHCLRELWILELDLNVFYTVEVLGVLFCWVVGALQVLINTD